MVKIGNIELGDFPLLLAPMEDVSDPPFRAVCKENGADLMYTEFISAEGLIRDAAKSLQKLDIYDYERPIGIQIFGEKIDSMREAAAKAEAAQPELIDINYGCPVKKVACKGAGAGILLDIPKMEEMTREIVKQVSLPVTVKTRLGWDDKTIKIVEVALRLQDAGIKALTIHGRTRQQMYKGVANWEHIREVKEHPDIEIPIFGNGDVSSPEIALDFKEKYGIDGIMIGRASIGYPWIFNEIKHFFTTGKKLDTPDLEDRIDTVKKHLRFSIEWKGERKGIFEMRRHYTNYFKGIPNFKPVRMKLHDHHPRFLSWILLILLTIVWGSSFILIKKGLTVYSASQVAAIRILSASLFMIPFAFSWLKRIDKKHLPLIFISGFIGSFIPAILFSVAQTQLDSAITGIVNSLTPVFVLLIGVLFYKQKITAVIIVGLLLAISGTTILIFYGSEGNHSFNYFALFVVAATVLYGINVNILKFTLSELNPIAISSISIFMIGPLAAIQLFGLTDFTVRLSTGGDAVLALIYLSILGVIGTSLALMLFNVLIKMTTPLFSSSVTYLIPIVAVIWGLIDGEKLFFIHYLSMAIIIFGVYLANRK